MWFFSVFVACNTANIPLEDSGCTDCEDSSSPVDDTADPVGDDPPIEWAALVINEFMAENRTTIAGDVGDYPDWIELYNPTSEMVSLDGWSMTDDLEDSDRVALDSSLEIPGGGFLLLWASGDPGLGPKHLDFQLNVDGESIGLYRPDGVATDRLTFAEQAADFSAARVPDGEKNWAITATATPGSSNGGK